mmetsp:Transcript_5239/g.9370  ORF Transcript_5239/g.9370 Transcript_5239/m.9370 type:complete len:232 (-) Transcript_5239:1917-2612(-)
MLVHHLNNNGEHVASGARFDPQPVTVLDLESVRTVSRDNLKRMGIISIGVNGCQVPNVLLRAHRKCVVRGRQRGTCWWHVQGSKSQGLRLAPAGVQHCHLHAQRVGRLASDHEQAIALKVELVGICTTHDLVHQRVSQIVIGTREESNSEIDGRRWIEHQGPSENQLVWSHLRRLNQKPFLKRLAMRIGGLDCDVKIIAPFAGVGDPQLIVMNVEHISILPWNDCVREIVG